MPFTSYAQNFEDVMLWRALKHIEKGCYVDVGAQHPIIDSVSKAFYERGWRGIHIEPVPAYAQMLRQDRPDETVLEIALSDSEGILELNVIPETGLSTAVAAYAQQHHATRGFDHQCLQVTSTTLNAALAPWAGKEIHWLKIDAEGLEGQILKGWDSTTLRPWIIVIEATIPGSSETGDRSVAASSATAIYPSRSAARHRFRPETEQARLRYRQTNNSMPDSPNRRLAGYSSSNSLWFQ